MFNPSPMMQQFYEIKAKYRDAILFFRLGDFYEMFGDDAILTAQLLDLTLTGRGKDENRVPMCGVPYHASERYLVKLVQKGFKVAIAEQVEEADGKNLTRREVVQIVTPATLLQQGAIQDHQDQYLAVLGHYKKDFVFLYVDVSTGKCTLKSLKKSDELAEELNRLAVKEVLVPDSINIQLPDEILVQHYNPFLPRQANEKICSHFGIVDVQVFALNERPAASVAVAALLKYLKEINQKVLAQIKTIQWQDNAEYVYLPATALSQLELVESLQKGEQNWTLFKVLNHTQTAMGARRLRKLCLHPYSQTQAIEKRLEAVDFLVKNFSSRQQLTQQLGRIGDVERLSSRLIGLGRNPRDLYLLANSLNEIINLAPILEENDQDFFKSFIDTVKPLKTQESPFMNFIKAIGQAFDAEAPQQFVKPGVLKSGHSIELDSLRNSFKTVKDYVAGLEAVERESTGIKTLKLGFNKVFGYYLEVSKGQSDAVPDHYIRKQTLSNAERFITPELKEKEAILLSAEQEELALEQKLYDSFIEQLNFHIAVIQNLAQCCAEVDIVLNFANLAVSRKYCRPCFSTEKNILSLKKARHPILEQSNTSYLVPNDIEMNQKTALQLITGPNMAGKSTLMRQVALISIMAQMGSFVPAETACLSPVDAVFTRIGAMDHLAKGQSTFMVEMLETAAILNQATANSLIILDEIGRGTSTYDGLSIAAAVAKDLHDRIGARTFFATHYHELADLVENFDQAQNMTMAIEEEGGKLLFKYLLVCGKAIQSYGVQVAHMAGLPQQVIKTASDFLESFESQSTVNTPGGVQQLALF